MIEILTGGEALDLPSDFSIEIEDSSPVFNDRGSQSVPATVPATRRNSRMLMFPYRLDAGAPPNGDSRLWSVVCGAYRRDGKMNVTSASLKDGISFNIGFDNSTVYAAWSKKRLSELSSMPVVNIGTDAKMIEFTDRLYLSADPQIDELALFPVVVDNESIDSGNGDNKKTEYYWEILNTPGDRGIYDRSTVKRIIDGVVTEVTVPSCYGRTPFVRVWRILELIFADMGCRLADNPFKSDRELARLVVLNNGADVCCTGQLHYAELMPDVTVDEFMNALWVRFGLVYNLDADRRIVSLAFIKDILRKDIALDLSTIKAGFPLVNYETPQYIRLSASTSIEGAAPTHERFEEFVRGYDMDGVRFGSDIENWTWSDVRGDWGSDDHDAADPDIRPSLSFEVRTCRWHKLDYDNGKVKVSSSSFFNWDPATPDMDAMELSSVDEWVPVSHVKLPWASFDEFAPMYLTGARHYHSYIKGCDDEDNKNEDSTPLAFMFAFTGSDEKTTGTVGRFSPAVAQGRNVKFADGSEHTLSLLFQFKDGLFSRFWRGYDEILRHSARSVEVPVRIRKSDLQRMDILAPVSMDGVRCLINKSSYSLPAAASVSVGMTLRVIQPHGDYNIDAEQGIPEFSPAGRYLVWELWFDEYDGNELQILERIANRSTAANAYIAKVGFKEYGTPGDYYCINANSAVPVRIERIPPVWDTDPSLPQPVVEGQGLFKKYKAMATYDIFVIHDVSQQPGDNDWELGECAVGQISIEVEYEVRLTASWTNSKSFARVGNHSIFVL